MQVRPNLSSFRKIPAILSIIALTIPPASATNPDPPRTGTGKSRKANNKHARTSQNGAASTPPMMHMPIVAPLFVQDRQFSSTLGMVNASNVSTFADVALTDMNGKQIAVKRVQFAPHSQQHLDILSVLESSVSAATTGRLTISQDPSLQGMAISAQLSMTFTGDNDTSYIDEEVAMPNAEGSQTLRAVTDESDGSPLVAITSLSDTTQRIQALCIIENDQRQKSIELAPQETLVTEACEAKTRPGWDLQAVLDHAEEAPRRIVGISISSDGMPGSFAAFGLSRRTKNNRQSFSSIDFADPMMTMSPNTVFTGIPVGVAPLLGEGKFVPELSLANFSDKSRHVTVKFAHTSEATPATSDVADLALEAGTIKHLKLEGLEGDPSLQNSFFVGSDGAPGDVLAKLVSVNDSDSETQVVGIFGKDEKEMNNGGNHPWSIENGNDSTILLFNHSAKPQPFYVLISSNSVQWQRIYTLAPMQTEAISVRQLVADQTKDDNGKVLSKKGQSGQLGWWNQDVGLGKGRLLLSNRENGMARNFSCSTLRGLCGIIYNQQIATFANGNTVIFASAIAMICEVYAVNQCNGTADTGTGGYNTSWSSQNSAIASISGPANQSTVSLYGAAVGGTTANVVINSPYCQRSGGGPVTVTPKILFGGCSGTDITNNNSNPQPVVVGQQIALCASYGGVSASSQSWNVPGTIVGGFTIAPTLLNGGPTTATVNQQSTTFYWVTSGNSQTVTFTLNYGSNQVAKAQAMFNIAGPSPSPASAPFVTTPLGPVAINPASPYPFLQFGSTSTSTPGLKFIVSANQPAGYSWSFKWINIISDDNVTMTDTNGTQMHSLGTGFDSNGSYPSFPNDTPNTASDSPKFPLTPPCTEIKRNFDTKTYLMWNAGLTNPPSIDIPLGSLTWGFSGDAVLTSGTWGFNVTPTKYAAGFTNSSSYPTWTSAHFNGLSPACP